MIHFPQHLIKEAVLDILFTLFSFIYIGEAIFLLIYFFDKFPGGELSVLPIKAVFMNEFYLFLFIISLFVVPYAIWRKSSQDKGRG